MKRILSFDGGGIRGILSLQIAARIEQLFRDEYGRPGLVLAEEIDLFAGTSTGAIIAACLAWGSPVAEVERLYLENSRKMFSRNWVWRWFRSKYLPDGLSRMFKNHFKEADGSPARLGSSKLKPKLLVVMRNATTGSPWPVTNNPAAKFNDLALDDCNLDIPLWQLLRASTAAPMYFPPQEISVGAQKFLFVDGGVTPYNNPALLAVLMATLPCYRLKWQTGRTNLHVTSIGTGARRAHLPSKKSERINFLDNKNFVIPALLGSASDNQDLLCRVLGHCLHGATIDMELDDLSEPSLLSASEQKFSYVRYNVALDTAAAGKPFTNKEMKMDNLRMIGRLQQIGRGYAKEVVDRSHIFPPAT